jgi:hypothetical protein
VEPEVARRCSSTSRQTLIKKTQKGKPAKIHGRSEFTKRRSRARPNPANATHRGAIPVKITTVEVEIMNTAAILIM